MNTDEMKKRAEEGAALAEKATPGPCIATETEEDVPCWYVALGGVLNAGQTLFEADWGTRDDAAFYADARTRVPALAADVLALLKENDGLVALAEREVVRRAVAEAERAALKAEIARLEKERDAAQDALTLVVEREDGKLHAAHDDGRQAARDEILEQAAR